MPIPPFRIASRHAAVVGVAFAATALFFHRAVFSTDVFIARDIFRVYYPLKLYWAQRVSEGGFPHWFPADGLGQPYVGMLISGAFHPANLLYVLFPLGVALKINVLLCYPIALLGAFALARQLGCSREASLLAGVAFAFCGFLVGISNNLLYLEAAATVPWVLWATDLLVEAPSPARVLGAAALLALIGLSGDGQTFAVTGGIVVAVALVHRPNTRSALVSVLAVALSLAFCAVQILPALATLPESGTSKMGTELTLTWSMHPLLLLELLAGSIFGGDPAAGTSIQIAQHVLATDQSSLWVESMHLGLPVLVLAVAGAIHLRRNRRFQLVALATVLILVLMLGKHAGLYRLFVEWVPFWRAFRYPLKLAPLLLLPVSLAAAAGFDALDQAPRLRRDICWALAGLAAAFALLWLTGDLTVRPAWATIVGGEMLERLSRNTTLALAQTALATIAVLLILTRVRPLRVRGALLVAAIGVHLFAVNEPLYLLADRTVLEGAPPFAELIRKTEPPRPEAVRVTDVLEVLPIPELEGHLWDNRLAAATSRSLAADSQVLWGLETSNAYLPATSSRYRELVKDKRLWLPRYSTMFATRYLVLPEITFRSIGGSRDSVFAEDRQFQLLLLRNERALDRAYLARPRCVADRQAAEQAIAHQTPAQGDAIVECDSPSAVSPTTALGTATIVSYLPERVEVTVDAKSEAVLVLNDAYYSGWSATVDGSSVPIQAANVAVRAVAVEPGAHTVVFAYRAPGLAAGAWISGISLLLACGCAAFGVQRKSRREKTTTASVKNAAV